MTFPAYSPHLAATTAITAHHPHTNLFPQAEMTNKLLRRRPFLLGGMLNGVTQGFSGSTFSEIKEERELSDVQVIPRGGVVLARQC